MARQEVNIGVEGNDRTGDSIRESFRKVNENFQELYAVFGIGGQISILDLSDTPDSYDNDAGKILAVRQNELGVEHLELASNSELDENEPDTVQFDYSVPGKLVVFTTFNRLQDDTAPELGASVDANNFAIGKVAVSEAAAQTLSAQFGEAFTIEDLVINKRFAEENYLKRGAPGISANLRDEPVDASEYTFTINSYDVSNVRITGHGLDSSSNGAPYKYLTTGTAAANLTNDSVYYVRIIDKDNISLHTTSSNALTNTSPIVTAGGSGTQTLTDLAYDNTLIGNWLDNEALPRKSVVRRQGDKMDGTLTLNDHPGHLSGINVDDDDALQAATKFYVDNIGFSSTINLYVNTQGDDIQVNSAPGREGRTAGTAFASINAACQKAEEIQAASPYEAGPYRQVITYGDGFGISEVTTAQIQNPVNGRQPAKVLLEANKEFIQKEVVAYINQTYPNLNYDEELCYRDIGLIVDSVILDVLSGQNANYLSRWAGIRYYSTPSGQVAVTKQRTETIAGITRAKILADIVLQNDAAAAPYTPIQSEIAQTIIVGQVPDGNARSSVGAKFDVVINTIEKGPLDAVTIVDGSVYEIAMTNGDFGNVDQGDITNTDLLPGKLVIGRTSGAKGIIINYINESDVTTVTPEKNDIIEIQLVEPVEFIPGEELEYGNTVREDQVTILVEAGIYYEDYPIRVPANVSIKGDEFRRTIVRPKNRISQSRWANVYFYRDKEFDGLTGDSGSITGFPDTNIPVTGTPYINPLTSQLDGYFGYHYLLDPTEPLNVSDYGTETFNRVRHVQASQLIKLNKDFIVEEFISYIDSSYPGFNYTESEYRLNADQAVDALVFDLANGGRSQSFEMQTVFYTSAGGSSSIVKDSIEHLKNVSGNVLANDSGSPFAKLGTVDQLFDASLQAETDSTLAVAGLIDLIAFSVDAEYNPARNNLELDVFLMNDATRLSNMTVQGHGGFMTVLDPEGQILTKSPYIQVGSSFSQSLNRQAFRGGMFVDAFCGNIPMSVISKDSAFILNVQSAAGEGLRFKKPQTPAPFYIDGARFQVNSVREWDPANGTAKLILDKNSNEGTGFTGTTDTLLEIDLDDLSGGGIAITVQTAGNRSMLGNDFTQVNDLGYGLITTNAALSEMVSMFTYYTHAAFYANNGGEIRSLNGSNAYGDFGLVAEGADPNEIPDAVTLRDNMIMPLRTFESPVILEFDTATAVQLDSGDVLTQATSGATGTVIFDTNGTSYTKVYLTNVSGTFDTTNNISVSAGTGSIDNISPSNVIVTQITNSNEQLSIYVFDISHPLQNRGEIEVYHSTALPPVFSRYEVANFEKQKELIVGAHFDVPQSSTSGSGISATFTVGSVRTGTAYKVYSFEGGSGYQVGDTITINGNLLGGSTPANNATITVDAVEGGVITEFTVAGTAATNNNTPKYNGQVYRLNFSTGTTGFSSDGLTTNLPANEIITYRQNGEFVFENVARVQDLVIRPSTAIIFEEDPEETYRSISFSNQTEDGVDMASGSVRAGFDINYDYVRLIVDSDNINNTNSAYINGGTTLGATAGDNAIAILPIGETNEIERITNNDMIFAWDGKLHRVSSYLQTSVTNGETFDVIHITDVSDIYSNTSNGLVSAVSRGNNTIALRTGLAAGEPATITINISTCRATGHDFLDIGTGGFNTSNYPNVILGNPSENLAPFYQNTETAVKGQVWERVKGRVFWVSTDQDGFFRVGRFFTVDQGTGSVTFAASIALSNLDGLGFKRGVVVAEFSTDSSMSNNATDTVPVQSAVRSYVNRRLGFNHNGAVVNDLIGPGVLPLDGSRAMTGDINMASNGISNLLTPSSRSDAANKGYVDDKVLERRNFDDLENTLIDPSTGLMSGVEAAQLLTATGQKRLSVLASSISNGPFVVGQTITASVNGGTGTITQVIEKQDSIRGNIVIIVYEDTSTGGDTIVAGQDVISVVSGPSAPVEIGPVDEISNAINSANSDLNLTLTRSETDATLEITYKSESIVNADISANAAISQSKLSMQAATTRADGNEITQADLGLASFSSDDFDVTNGWVSLKDLNLQFSDLPQIANNTVLGNVSGETADIAEVGITTTGEFDKILRTQSDGSIRVASLRLGGNNDYQILSLDGTTLNVKTPGQGTVLSAQGTDATMVVTIPGNLQIGDASITEGTLQNSSQTYNGESRLSVDWIYAKVIEDMDEKGSDPSVSNGISIGNNAPYAGDGIVSIFVKNGTNTAVPLKVSNTGLISDANDTYDIGSTDTRFKGVYTNVLDAGGNVTLAGSSTDTITAKTDILPDTNNAHNLGSSTVTWDTVYAVTFQGTATQAKYADLAEMYAADDLYEAGTVVVFGGEYEITQTDRKGDRRVAGVVSTDPAHLMNSGLVAEYPVAIALQGRVPCKVLGKVEKGDLLVTSAVPGYAVVDNEAQAGTIIGKALENKEDSGKGIIEAVVGRV